MAKGNEASATAGAAELAPGATGGASASDSLTTGARVDDAEALGSGTGSEHAANASGAARRGMKRFIGKTPVQLQMTSATRTGAILSLAALT